MRLAVEKFSYANRSAIIGVRAPMFTVAGKFYYSDHALKQSNTNTYLSGDEQMSTLRHLGFRYDSSIAVKNGPFWPQTLNHRY